MKIRKAFKYCLEPTTEQEQNLNQFLGARRWVWNHFLAIQKNRLENNLPLLTKKVMINMLPALKKTEEFNWLSQMQSQILQQVIMDLDKAIWDCLKPKSKESKKQLPRFKKKNINENFRIPVGTKIDNRRVFISKIGYVKFKKSREILGEIKNYTVSKKCKKYYISLQTEKIVSEPIHKNIGSMIGIDLGVNKLVTCSDGTIFEPNKSLIIIDKKIRREQKKLSKKKKFGKNWIKQKQKISKLKNKETNIRIDNLHKISDSISKNHAIIAMENLMIDNMTKSAKGTLEEPGKNVKQKSGLNRSILNQGWGILRQQIDYKTQFRGGKLLLVDPKNTSRACSNCGHACKENRKKQNFKCVACGHKLDADINAAINIRERAIKQL